MQRGLRRPGWMFNIQKKDYLCLCVCVLKCMIFLQVVSYLINKFIFYQKIFLTCILIALFIFQYLKIDNKFLDYETHLYHLHLCSITK